LANAKKDKDFYSKRNNQVNEQIDLQIKKFRATKLTSYEEETLENFAKNIKLLKSNEQRIFSLKADQLSTENIDTLNRNLEVLQTNLRVLLGIQLEEGKRKVSDSGKAVKSMYQYESFENYALAILGILMLVVIFIPRQKEKDTIAEKMV
jgi:cellobiose phosphorylase